MNKKTEELMYEAQNVSLHDMIIIQNNRYYEEQLEIYLRVYQLILYKLDYYSQFSSDEVWHSTNTL